MPHGKVHVSTEKKRESIDRYAGDGRTTNHFLWDRNDQVASPQDAELLVLTRVSWAVPRKRIQMEGGFGLRRLPRWV